MAKKTCRDCTEVFAPDMMANGLRCKGCQRARLRAARVQKVYSISEDQYQALLAHQGGRCFICHKRPGVKRLAVDHDHSCCAGPTSCGKCVRGLLCRQCNRDVLGNLKDSVAALYRAIEYLEDWPARAALRNLT